jgi:hypothetical protein
MDKIFREIKQAIEEEMARQEGRPVGGSPSTQGRDASRYERWLEEEQERLRGSGQSTRDTQPQGIEDITVLDAPRIPREGSRREQRQRDKITRAAEAAEAAQKARTESLQRSTRHERAEVRHQQRTDAGYDQRRTGRSAFSTGIWQMLRTRRGLQQAILLGDILGKPVSLRRPDDHLIS